VRSIRAGFRRLSRVVGAFGRVLNSGLQRVAAFLGRDYFAVALGDADPPTLDEQMADLLGIVAEQESRWRDMYWTRPH
jgi:hypothetical protein